MYVLLNRVSSLQKVTEYFKNFSIADLLTFAYSLTDLHL